MKKVLVISYYWPPAGGPGVQRVLNFVQQLPEFGWEPLVLTVENPSAPARDESLMARIPESCRVFRTKTREPFFLYKILTGKKHSEGLPKNIVLGSSAPSLREKCSQWIRANAFIPDARKGWKSNMIRRGMRIITEEQVQLIFSTSPPHSLQPGAEILAKRSGLPWVADLRDPWTEAYWEQQLPKTRRSREKNRKLERRVLHAATHITTVGRGISELIGSKTEKPVTVIYSGWRETDSSPLETEDFEILHLGNLSKLQSCSGLLDAVEMLEAEIRKRVRLVFIGSLDPGQRRAIDARPELKVSYYDQMPYETMMQHARRASMLFLPPLESSYAKGLITAKIFDYLALRRPVIAFGGAESDIAAILADTQSGKVFEKAGIREASGYISDCYRQWNSGGPLEVGDPFRLKTYASQTNTAALAGIFDSLISL